MVFVRGQSQDYDTWAQLGNRGWSYREVLPIFRDMESYQGDADDEYRGRGGPLKVTENYETGPLYDALIKAAGEVGIEYTKDYNGASQDGIGMTQATIRNGRRMSTAFCYLDPARERPNLTIQANALTECLLIEGKRCVGVRYTINGQQHEARAGREVIVSAGSINSPQLLELSGIGQPERLQSLGIEVRHALKGVGENLRDHYSPRMKWTVPSSLGMTYNDKGRGVGLVWQALKYALTNKGLLGLPAAPIRAYIRTRAGLDAPDAAISWIPFLAGANFKLAKQLRHHRDHEHPPLGEHRQRAYVIESAEPAAGDPFQLLDRPTRSRSNSGSDAHHPAHHDGTRHAGDRHRRNRARREHPGGRRIARLDQEQRRNHLSSGRHLQDGLRPDGGGGRSTAGARHGRAARGGCLDHANAHLGQHQCAVDHDRRESVPHGAGGGVVWTGQRLA